MRAIRRLVAGLAFLMAMTSAQDAYAVWGWLEKLSGPGHFRGVVLPIPLWCSSSREWGGGLCRGIQTREDFFMVSLVLSNLDSTKNDLTYGPEIADEDKKVDLKSWSLVLSKRLHPSVDIGVGAGVSRFSGALFPTFHRVSLDLPRIGFRPLAIKYSGKADTLSTKERILRELVQLNVGFVLFPTGFDAQDFGAVPGSYSVSSEWLWQASISIGIQVFF